MVAKFLSHTSVYQGDYSGIMRNPECEFNQGLHYHDFYEIQIYFSNAGFLTIGDKKHSTHSGDVAFINIFEPHHFSPSSENNYERFSISVDPSFLLSVCSDKSNLLGLFIPANKHFPVFHLEHDRLKVVSDVINEYEQTKFRYGQDLLERALLYKILAYLYNYFFDGCHINFKESQHTDLITRLIKFISAHLNEDLSLERLAEEVHFSTFHICRIFKKYTDNTITNYIISKRIERAKFLLGENTPIVKISEETGFNNYAYFFKAFKKITGYGPMDYRKTMEKV
jgi:AraC-like DNA-binding protein